MPITQSFALEHGGVAEYGPNWRVQFADADGIPLNMVSFEWIDFGAISYKEIFQNVKTILATPIYSAALERTLGIDQTIIDLPIDAASQKVIAILDAITWWEPRVVVMNIDFDYSDAVNGHTTIKLQLRINNVIYGTNKPYTSTNIYATPDRVTQSLPDISAPAPIVPEGPAGPSGPQGPTGPPGATGPKGQRGSIWFTGNSDPTTIAGVLPNDMYLNTTTAAIFQYDGNTWRKIFNGMAT